MQARSKSSPSKIEGVAVGRGSMMMEARAYPLAAARHSPCLRGRVSGWVFLPLSQARSKSFPSKIEGVAVGRGSMS